MYIVMNVCMHEYVYISKYVRVVCWHEYSRVCVNECVNAGVYKGMFVSLSVYISTSVSASVQVCESVHVHDAHLFGAIICLESGVLI